MHKPKRVIALSLAIVMQLTVLAGVYLNAMHPIWTGDTYRIKTVPVDPRSLFRGNYARLTYEISNIPANAVKRIGRLRANEPVYVKLRPGQHGLMQYDGVSLKKPEDGVFIRGRIQRRSARQAGFRVKYGIEAYFAPRHRALALEKQLRHSAVAVIKIAPNGKAALLEVDPLE